MYTTLWVIQLLLALVFGFAGLLKLGRPRRALADRMSWVEDASDVQVKAVGGLEVLAAIGLVLPPVVGIATFLTPLAATGVVLLMVGATVTHVRLGETQTLWINALLLMLAAIVAVGRFGPYHL